MTRHNVVVAYQRDKRCPVCDKYNNKSYYGLAMHIAMKGNNKRGEVHREWRIKNDLPADYTHRSETRMIASKIMEIFGWDD
jgi:hypothetical protein